MVMQVDPGEVDCRTYVKQLRDGLLRLIRSARPGSYWLFGRSNYHPMAFGKRLFCHRVGGALGMEPSRKLWCR